MVSQVILDEIEALGGIFCADREFEVQSIGEKEVILVIQPQQIRSHLVSLTVILDPKTYPISSPLLSVQCAKLNRIELQNLNSQIEQEASKLKGEVMILSLVEWLVDNIVINFEDATSPLTESLREKDESNDCTIVAQLDHIRSRAIYMKTLNQWFRELELHGVLIFYRRWIFLLVSGKKHSLQAYQKRHRTQNVDIDSGGRPCKERLLSHLGQVEETLDASGVVLDQVELNDSSEDWLKYWSSRPSLASIYQKFIQPQTGQKK